MRRSLAVIAASLSQIAVLFVAGCAESQPESRREQQPVAEQQQERQSAAIPMENIDALAQFFRRKAGDLQYRCYNPEIERTGNKKLAGSVAVSLIVLPGGKASGVKIVKSTMGSPELESCVVSEVEAWSWPDVPGQVPYQGAVEFKPAY